MPTFALRWCKARGGVFAFALITQIAPAHATEACEPTVGRFVSVEGSVEVQRSGQGPWAKGKLDEPLCQGDAIRVGERSRAAVALINDAVLRLDQRTAMRLLDIAVKEGERSLLELIVGAFQSFSRAPRVLEVNTPYINGLIEGTEFVMRVEADQASITVFEGKVAAANDIGRLLLAGGESAVAKKGEAPQPQIVIRPRDAVQWALYYPPVLSVFGAQANQVPPGAPSALQGLLEALARGDTASAFNLLERTPPSQRGAQYRLYRASLLLNVGRADEAHADIEGALAQDPNASLAYALRSVLHVVQNERGQALTDAKLAVARGTTPASKIALSYAQQANFQLEAARDTLLSAVKEYPTDPLSWARLGELWLMLGNRSHAVDAARKAQSLAPDSVRAQLVFGFTALAEFRNAEAKAAFGRAIAVSSADPLGHLGLGLAKISDGKLSEGRQELETAVALDGNSALLRSYLGKAYFEEKRSPLDTQQYGIAKKLDPLDPTAYLYEGILKQTVNRPVEALHDLETSVELNDNRSVYRSRLLLDEDRAARGTSLARVYKDLGFTQLGINESTESIGLDPSNASAHRFLSDTYLAVRRREIARVSELLQAQLLQDININPVQPSISETNLNIVTIGGPATAGFNEFTPLFQQNTVKLDVTSFGGNHNTYGGEGVISALYDRVSFSVGGFGYNSDGWRPNNQVNQSIFNVFAQAAITPDLNIQTEFRRRSSGEGDLAFNFIRDDFLRDKTINRDLDTVRFGLRYSPMPGSHFLFSFINSDREGGLMQSQALDPLTMLLSNSQTKEGGQQYEAQYIYRQGAFNLIAGAAHSNVDGRSADSLELVDLNIGPFFSFNENPVDRVKQSRGYLYSNIALPRTATWTLGFSYDQYEEKPLELTSFNPKLGMQWNITDNFRLRAAVFKALKPRLVNNRTIEPTQVAGFNQLFDDISATASWRYGGGFAWRLRRDLSLGGEMTWRRLKEPVFLFQEDGTETVALEKRREYLHSLYLYWTPFNLLGVKAEFLYDRYKSESGILTNSPNLSLPEEVQTISAPLTITYFNPSGFFASLGGTFVDQRVQRAQTVLRGGGNDNFFLVDAAVGYRLPKRLGVISIAVKNLFDTEFQYQDDSYREFRDEPSIGPYFPRRIALARITLNF